MYVYNDRRTKHSAGNRSNMHFNFLNDIFDCVPRSKLNLCSTFTLSTQYSLKKILTLETFPSFIQFIRSKHRVTLHSFIILRSHRAILETDSFNLSLSIKQPHQNTVRYASPHSNLITIINFYFCQVLMSLLESAEHTFTHSFSTSSPYRCD